MSFPPHLPDQVYEFAVGVKTALSDFFYKMIEKAAELGKPLVEKLPPEKRRPVLMVSAGAFAVLALVFAGIPVLTRGKSEEQKPASASVAGNVPARQGIIPPDEVFLPDEPDFVPGVMLERERRTRWTDADAAPLWQDPLKNGEEPWRNRIEKTIDEIMESVP
ncbi:MAG: hypothetical protein LBH20_01210 [Treponema sp.]|jgi:hypothetical protein|nr:hypothetical protein [Treponema sp.]